MTGAAHDIIDNVDLDKLGDDENNFSDLLKESFIRLEYLQKVI